MTRVGFVFGFLLAVSDLGAQQFIISTLAGGAPPATPAAARSSSIGDPPRVAVDSSGNFYFAGLHSVFKADATGTLTRIAGTGRAGSTGDGGLAVNAQLAYPAGIAVDVQGATYVADLAGAIRKIASDGTISTIAGSVCLGSACISAIPRFLVRPSGLALDSSGNLYVADMALHRVLKFAPDGSYTVVAGTGVADYSGDGGPADSAALNGPQGVAVDSSGTLYIADTFNNRVRQVALDGTITTVAGTGLSSYSKDGTAAAQAGLFLPTGVAVDAAGNLFIADYGNGLIRQVSRGLIRTVAGSLDGAPPVEGQEATSAEFNGPTGLAVDSAGTIYFAEGSIGTGTGLADGDFRIWMVATDGTLHTAAGNGINSYSGDGGAGTLAQLDTPGGVALDSKGNLYIADSHNHRVRKISPGGAITTVAGTGVAGFSGDGGPSTNAQLNHPTGVAVDSAGDLYIADSGNNRVRWVSVDGNMFTIAGNGNAAFFGDGGPATAAALHNPRSVAVDSAFNVYVADTLDYRVRKFTIAGTIATVAGNGLQGSAGDGGLGTNAQLNLPVGVTVDDAGALYIVDQGAANLRRLSPQDNVISTVPVGGGHLTAPAAVAVDSSGNLYISDSLQNRIFMLAGGTLVPIAGNGACCYSGDGGPAGTAQVNAPWGVAVDPAGIVYFADSGNNAIRTLQPGTTAPAITAIANGASNAAGPIAPGEIVVIFGSGLGPAQLVTSSSGVSVTFNGIPGQILYASAGQVSAVVPPGLSGVSAQVSVHYLLLDSAPVTVTLAPASPAIFTSNATGTGQAVAVNQDGSLNDAGHPASIGSTITLYATGMGILPGPAVTVTVGGQTASGVQQGGGPPGVIEVSAQIPGSVQPGSAVPITIQIANLTSPAGVTIAVK